MTMKMRSIDSAESETPAANTEARRGENIIIARHTRVKVDAKRKTTSVPFYETIGLEKRSDRALVALRVPLMSP